MLAYDLYLANKDTDQVFVTSLSPIIKIFFMDGGISVDDSAKSPVLAGRKSMGLVQEWLSMHLNNASYKQTGLVDMSVGPSQKPPYAQIYCNLEKKREGKNENRFLITMSMGKSPNASSATYDVNDKKLSFEKLVDIDIRLSKDGYFTKGGGGLFDQYVAAGIVDGGGRVPKKVFQDAVNAFVKYVEKQSMPDLDGVGKKTPFRMYILPTMEAVEKKADEKSDDADEFIDAFGAKAKGYPDKTTLTFKSLSADDRAFPINCTDKKTMYQNLGIGDVSLDKVELCVGNIMWVGGLEWMFTDMANSQNTFDDVKGGILRQIHANYRKLDDNHTKKEMAEIKVMCLLRNQNKMEVLLDENLTLERQKRVLGRLGSIPPGAAEVMIPKQTSKNSKNIWTDYVYVVKSFLAERPIRKDYFVGFFTRQAREQVQDMLDGKTDAASFFERSQFLITFLSDSSKGSDEMTSDEEYAYNIGRIARCYIDYKRRQNEENNSLMGILRYNRYDIASLRNVLSKVGAGIANSKAKEGEGRQKHSDALMKAESEIQGMIPKSEIENEGDYTYFFYKGYFTGGQR